MWVPYWYKAMMVESIGSESQQRRISDRVMLSYPCCDAHTQTISDLEDSLLIQTIEDIVYDLEVKTYNDLVHRRQASAATPCILILKVLPTDAQQWLTTTESGLFLGGACYWEYLRGELSENKQSVRIRISRTQELHPESLLMLMISAREYAISGEWIC